MRDTTSLFFLSFSSSSVTSRYVVFQLKSEHCLDLVVLRELISSAAGIDVTDVSRLEEESRG